uniref:Peptidase A1 domain-containing protein n=1 Tax=Setaria italica TaxID=4555 RepID=K3ZM04_SETIT
MEMKVMTALAIITPLFLHHLSFTIADHTRAFSNSSAGFSLPIFAKQSPDRTIRRGTDGFLYLQHSLSASAANITTVGPVDDRLHLTEVHFGTGDGRRKLLLELDATAPLTWIQCIPCHPVATQTGPLFDGELSPTFQHVHSSVCTPPFHPDPTIHRCQFSISNPMGLLVQGLLSVDQYTREDGLVFPRFFFGCVHETHNFHNINTFAGIFAYRKFAVQAMANRLTRSSYCLFRETNRQGFLRFGTEADIPHKPHYQTTRILPANDVHESAYYVSLAGVSVGERRLSGVRPEMFARRKDGQGGSIIDLGTPLMEIVEEVYHVVEEAVWSDLERYGAERVEQAGYGLCIQATEAIKGRLQSLSLHFAEEEATLVISPKQLFLMMDNKQAGQIACLAMQVDTRFVYDLKDNKLSFAPESCIQDTVPVV